ncbi:AP-1 complex subunit gamma-1 [Strigomonas culicis]|uniref:AP-1 complex subunit gamma n=1 Tax=Strigomonas culicis TaxID=28005 RepID=S9U5P2_9TRYP|nr:AP-1 complex subunit gamma-1 [Strigomonas culicis]EPY32662.1 AP-1 complex subunit gamma-1 [Strigomonas culicis]|eukprot:EPY24278.1 AP-1 complex subunit gamma-1 [Strigomonas culicis]
MSMNSMRLRELIRSVRKCKTADEERRLVNRECAVIREGFEENTPYLRSRCMLKLLYIRMLGYPTEFGQLEVVNLLSQKDFNGKRIGYLALQLLLDEKDEVLTLAENHMKKDLSSVSSLEQMIALNAAANVASVDMSRDVFDDVMKLVESDSAAVKRKACLTALHIVKKVPEHAEYFLEKLTDMFQNNLAQTLLTALTLVNQCLLTEQGACFLPNYRRLATAAVRVLKSLVLSSRVTAQDVSGITDPFVQVKLLEFMRIIGRGSLVTSEALNDVLAQVLTNTDSSKNVGCAIHYECVRTINAIESDDGLRLLAINTITRFLSNKDNNLRFVALQCLLDYVEDDLDTVQQHRAVVLECLTDPDISIRRRALELTVALVTNDNIRLIVPDLLTYLTLCTDDMRAEVTHHVCTILETKSPNDEWRVELSLKLLKLSRQHAKVDFAKHLIAVLSNQPEDVKRSAMKVLWEEAYFPFDAIHHARKAFMMVAIWALGEYTDVLLRTVKDITCKEVALCLCDITSNTSFNLLKRYGLTALMKLATRYPETQTQVLANFSSSLSSLDCELQQRACEFTQLLSNFPEEAKFSFSRMPPIAIAPPDGGVQPVQIVTVSAATLQTQTATALDDLFGFDGPKPDSIADQVAARAEPVTATLDNLFGAAPAAPAAAVPRAHVDPLAHGTSGSSSPRSTSQVVSPTKAKGTKVFECGDFSTFFATHREGRCL